MSNDSNPLSYQFCIFSFFVTLVLRIFQIFQDKLKKSLTEILKAEKIEKLKDLLILPNISKNNIFHYRKSSNLLDSLICLSQNPPTLSNG